MQLYICIHCKSNNIFIKGENIYLSFPIVIDYPKTIGKEKKWGQSKGKNNTCLFYPHFPSYVPFDRFGLTKVYGNDITFLDVPRYYPLFKERTQLV